MIRRALIPILATILLTAGAGAQPAPNSPVPPDEEIRKILVERIDTFHQGVGIVVGVIDAHGRRVVSYGGLEFFKRELERQRDLLQNVGKWYLGPLVPGLVIITIASARSNPGHLRHFALFLTVYGLFVVFLFVYIWKLNHRAARKLQRQIDELDALREPR